MSGGVLCDPEPEPEYVGLSAAETAEEFAAAMKRLADAMAWPVPERAE